MEYAVPVHIELLPKGYYLAISDELQGLVAQERTVSETLEIARDVAQKLIGGTSRAGYYATFAEYFGVAGLYGSRRCLIGPTRRILNEFLNA